MNDYNQRLPCFCRYYGANLEYFFCVFVTAISGRFLSQTWRTNGAISPTKIILLEKRNIGYLTGSLVSENIRSSSKVNDLSWLLFWFSWPSCLLLARHNAMLGYRLTYTNACLALAVKHHFKIWDDRVINKRLNCVSIYFTCDFMNMNIF